MTKLQIPAYHTSHLRLRCVLLSCHQEKTLMNPGASIIKSQKVFGHTTVKRKHTNGSLKVKKR